MVDQRAVVTPEAVLGYQMGEARRLPDWHEIVAYFEQLAAASDRVQIEYLGESTRGLPYIAVMVSSPDNLRTLETQRQRLARLYDPRDVDDDTVKDLTEQARVTAFLLCTQHSNEIGAAVMTLELASDLANADDSNTHEILDNVITVIIPSHNPDGHQMIVEWYRQWLGTPYEGQPMPWLYHHYVGHDNNRDWFMQTQIETQHYVRLFNREHPQLVFDMHQMQRDGARFMVPPFIDPLDPNQDPVIQQGFADLGTAISTRLTAAGKAGVAGNIIFDNYSPSLAYGNYHGSVDILSEAASCNLATPVNVPEEKLKAEHGFDPRQRTWNHPLPWKGGEWTLRDIVEYDKLAALAFLEHAARNRRQWLTNYVGIMRRGITPVDQESAFAFVIPEVQDDPGVTVEMLDILVRGDVLVEQAANTFVADGVSYPAGTRVVRLHQPAGRFAKTLLEVQTYPELRTWPGGPLRPPYDIAGHTLPLQMGVRAIEVRKPFEADLQPAVIAHVPGRVTGAGIHGWTFSARTNRSVLLANRLLARGVQIARIGGTDASQAAGQAVGDYLIAADAGDVAVLEQMAHDTGVDIRGVDGPPGMHQRGMSQLRVGVYQSWRPTIDEGWVRWIFEEYEQPYETLHDVDIRQGGLAARFDTIVLPQQKPEDMLNGNPKENSYKEPYPPEYVGGLGQVGVDALREFVEAGGTLVALDAASVFAIQHLYLPVKNVVDDLKPEEFYCPGSLLRVLLDPAHPLAYGLRREEVALFMRSPVFEATDSTRVTMVGRYPQYLQNLSGWITGESRIAGKVALAEVTLGRGRVVLIGFRCQFRAQARGTYRVLFNALRVGHYAGEP